MSRIGKAPVKMVKDVTVEFKDSVVTVKGKHGELTQLMDDSISLEINDDEITFVRSNELKQTKAFHGLYRSLVNNMIIGVSEGFTTQQELVGVGYRAAIKGNLLEMSLGYSHPVIMEIPKEVKATAETVKGQPPLITLFSHDKQLVGQVAAKIRSLRKPEPYKGKGIRFKGEILRRKAGKTAAK